MRSQSPTNTVYSLGKYSQSQLRKMNMDKYQAERGIVKQKMIKLSTYNNIDQPNQKVIVPTQLNFGEQNDSKMNSNTQINILQQSEQISKRRIEQENEMLRQNLIQIEQQMQQKLETMKKNYDDYLKRLEVERNKYKEYERMYERSEDDKRRLQQELHRIQLELNLLQNNGQNNNNENNQMVEMLKQQILQLQKENFQLKEQLQNQENNTLKMRTEINEIRQNQGANKDKELLRELSDANNKIHMLEKELQQQQQKENKDKDLTKKNKKITILEERIEKIAQQLEIAKTEIQCKDCDSKNITINKLNEKINDLTKPVSTSYIRSPSPVIRRSCSYICEENGNTYKPKVTRVSCYNNNVSTNVRTQQYPILSDNYHYHQSTSVQPKVVRYSHSGSGYQQQSNNLVRNISSRESNYSTRYVNKPIRSSYYKEEIHTNKYETGKMGNSYLNNNTSMSTTYTTPQSYTRSNSMYVNQPINIYTDKEVNVFDKNGQPKNENSKSKNYSEYF